MRINTIEPGGKLSLSVNINGKILQFTTRVAIVLPDSVLVDPITQNGRKIGFTNYNVQVVYEMQQDKPIIWAKTRVILVKYKGDTFHQIFAEGPGAILNRRDGVRQPVGVKGIATGKDFRQEVMIRDISANGISFYSDKSFPTDGNIRINFTDMNYDFSLAVNICWSSNEENLSRFTYGCRILSKNIRIEAYIHAKQRQEE